MPKPGLVGRGQGAPSQGGFRRNPMLLKAGRLGGAARVGELERGEVVLRKWCFMNDLAGVRWDGSGCPRAPVCLWPYRLEVRRSGG